MNFKTKKFFLSSNMVLLEKGRFQPKDASRDESVDGGGKSD